ncbi:conserved phage C-terminal domain-containing protein [Aeromonas media]|uniref:conserved phage C-terminal domain-containing protein n=1 Tax=Aeromonas media TaxID=651 RepID=UPI003D2118D9
MGEVVRLAAPVAAPVSRGCNVADNRRSGFVLLYKSLKEVPFYRDPVRKALWLHLLLEAAHERCEVSFNGNRLLIQRGQVVGSARSLGEACGISEDSARRSLDAFEQEGMISRSSKQGTRGYTLVTLLNYDPYQRGVSEHIGAEFRAELQPASKQGTEGVSQSDGAELGAEYHAEDLNKINNKTNKDLKDSSSQLADATFDQQGEGTAIEGVADPEPKARVIREAAIQTPSGKAWGTGDDLMTAQWMFRRVQLITPTAIEPNWAQWANVIRLMRELDQRSHRDICELYDWVSRDAFWCANVLSPQKLRQKWDQLQAKRGNPSGGHQRPLSNLAQAQQQAQALRAAGVDYDDNTPL